MNAQAKAAQSARPAETKASAALAAREVTPQLGNMALQEHLRSGALRPQLTVGRPDDPAETDADRMAEAVTAPCACGGGGCASCGGGKTTLRRQIKATATASGGNAAMAREVAFGGSLGRPLPLALRAQFEPRFGADFSSVRIHDTPATAATAEKISANAYTAGSDIGFAPGQFAPDTRRGQKLLAHELAHTLQNNGTTIRRDAPPGGTPDPAPQTASPAADPAPGATSDPGANPAPKIVPAPDPKGELVVNNPTKVTFSDSPEYIRYQLEMFIATQGMARLIVLEGNDYSFGKGLGPFLDAGATTVEQATYVQRVIAMVHAAITTLRFDMTAYLKDFERRAVDQLNAMLDASKAKVEAERARYDVSTAGGEASVATGKETEDLTARARVLTAKQQAVVAAKSTLDNAQQFGPNGELPPGGVPVAADQEKLAAAQHAYDAAVRDYSIARNAAELRHPILVSYGLDPLAPGTPGTLAKLGAESSTTQAEALAQEINQKLENIETVRSRVLADWGKVWELPNVIAAAQQLPDMKNYKGLQPTTCDAAVSDKRANVAFDAELVSAFTGITLLMVGLIAAIPTGGLSAGAAAGVAAAGTAEQALLAFTAYQSYQKYQFDAAASGTDFDKAKSISQEEPSWFSVAVDLLAAFAGPAADVYRMAKSAFSELLAMRRTYLAARAANKLSEAYPELNALIEKGNGIKSGLGSELATETRQLATTASEHAEEISEIERNLGHAKVEADGSITVPIDPKGEAKGQYWKGSKRDGWCRFASPPQCFPPGSIESQAIDAQLDVKASGAAAAAGHITLTEETKQALIQKWRAAKANPDLLGGSKLADLPRAVRRQKFDKFINNLEKNLPPDWEQSEMEIQWITNSGHQKVKLPDGNWGYPDIKPGTGWLGEAKKWNIEFATWDEARAAANGKLPAKLQGLVDQINRRRLAVVDGVTVGNNQMVVIDVRGQFSVKNVAADVAAKNKATIQTFRGVVTSATKLPPENIVVLTN